MLDPWKARLSHGRDRWWNRLALGFTLRELAQRAKMGLFRNDRQSNGEIWLSWSNSHPKLEKLLGAFPSVRSEPCSHQTQEFSRLLTMLAQAVLVMCLHVPKSEGRGRPSDINGSPIPTSTAPIHALPTFRNQPQPALALPQSAPHRLHVPPVCSPVHTSTSSPHP